MSEARLAKAGKLICVDGGEYSDYGVTGFFVVLSDFDPMDELATYLDANPAQRSGNTFKEEAYLAGLLAKGLLLELEYGVLHLGSYSCCSDMRFTPSNERDSVEW